VTRRLNITLAVKRLVRDVAVRLPELAHVRASRVLVVAGEARRNSRATIRPAHFGATRRRVAGSGGPTKALIRVKGRKILYVVTLRPLWFLASTPEERIATIVHELYHASTRFDGTLHRARRHTRLPLQPEDPDPGAPLPRRRAARDPRALRARGDRPGPHVARAARRVQGRGVRWSPGLHREAALLRARPDAVPPPREALDDLTGAAP
jgi:predicted metallopeptidase